jgi:hypothetical protein
VVASPHSRPELDFFGTNAAAFEVMTTLLIDNAWFTCGVDNLQNISLMELQKLVPRRPN